MPSFIDNNNNTKMASPVIQPLKLSGTFKIKMVLKPLFCVVQEYIKRVARYNTTMFLTTQFLPWICWNKAGYLYARARKSFQPSPLEPPTLRASYDSTNNPPTLSLLTPTVFLLTLTSGSSHYHNYCFVKSMKNNSLFANVSGTSIRSASTSWKQAIAL